MDTPSSPSASLSSGHLAQPLVGDMILCAFSKPPSGDTTQAAPYKQDLMEFSHHTAKTLNAQPPESNGLSYSLTDGSSGLTQPFILEKQCFSFKMLIEKEEKLTEDSSANGGKLKSSLLTKWKIRNGNEDLWTVKNETQKEAPGFTCQHCKQGQLCQAVV